MNDFTKGELQIILLEMNISLQRTPKQLKVSPVFIELRDKVESMIDNYCEHKNTGQCAISEQVLCRDCGEEVH